MILFLLPPAEWDGAGHRAAFTAASGIWKEGKHWRQRWWRRQRRALPKSQIKLPPPFSSNTYSWRKNSWRLMWTSNYCVKMGIFGVHFEHFSAFIGTLARAVTDPPSFCDHVLCIQQEIKMRFICWLQQGSPNKSYWSRYAHQLTLLERILRRRGDVKQGTNIFNHLYWLLLLNKA